MYGVGPARLDPRPSVRDYCPVGANLPAESRPRLVGIAIRFLFTYSFPPFSIVAAFIDDFYHKKTDAELQFFIDYPELYQPSLIDAARR